MPPAQRRVLIIGGSFAGLCVARDLNSHFLVTIVDAKEFFEYTPGILRAYVHTDHFDALTFSLQPVIEGRMGCKFIWGEVTELNGKDRLATIKPMFGDTEVLDFDFCVIAAGCNFGVFHKWGESLWFPTIHEKARPEGDWPHIDERYIQGRRQHIHEEYQAIKAMNEGEGQSVLVAGAGFIGVEWVTELEYYFPKLKLTIVDFLNKPLGPLPERAATYCQKYMDRKGITQKYGLKYAPTSQDFWDAVGLPKGADKQYVCVGVKASNYFMPEETKSLKGPGGGGWILMDRTLAVTTRDNQVWSVDEQGHPRIYAIGDCNYGCVEHPTDKTLKPDQFLVPPIPKISYPGEEEAIVAIRNIEVVDKLVYKGAKTSTLGFPLQLNELHWPWGAGMFATSLGPVDACFVAGANWEKNSGIMCVWGRPCAWQKWIIEWSKVDECKFGVIGRLIWHFVHHTPVHLFGGGPRWGY